MAKIRNTAGYPPPAAPWVAPTSVDTHTTEHPKPGAGGGGS